MRYRVALNDFVYHAPGVPFAHRHGDHGAAGPTTVALILSVIAVEELVPVRAVTDFVTVAGKTLSRRAMRGLYVVDDPDVPEAGPHAQAAVALAGTA